jgi:5-methylcytosine-specific restriction protein A
MSKQVMEPECALCNRLVSTVSWHHLLPKAEGGKHTETVPLCQPCHSTIHRTFTNRQLAKQYSKMEELKKAPELQPYLEWIKTRKVERLQHRKGKRSR